MQLGHKRDAWADRFQDLMIFFLRLGIPDHASNASEEQEMGDNGIDRRIVFRLTGVR